MSSTPQSHGAVHGMTTSPAHVQQKSSKTNRVSRNLGALISKLGSNIKKRRPPEARTDNSTPLKDADHGTSILVASSASEEAQDAHLPFVTSTPPANNAGDAELKSALTPRRMTAQPIIGPEDPHEPTSPMKTGGRAKEPFAVAGRFAQTVIKNLPDLVDGNPVKIAFSIARLIIETRNSITENHEAIDRYMLNAAEKLNAIQAATNNGTQVPQDAEDALHRFTIEITDVLKGLEACKNASGATKVFDFENQSKRIEEIFGAIVTATENFQIQMAVCIQTTADRIDLNLKRQALRSLNPVRIAEYDAQISGKYFWRGECTPGTRTDILKDIQDWVEDASPANNICWLTGHAGSGKTAILYTIAKRADDLAETTASIDNPRLGATFFCSRQFSETREPDRIIPTIVSQLAEICQPFEDALQASSVSGAYPSLFQTTSISIRTQITGLLVIPWQQCAAKRAQNRYLIVIDALDEVNEQGASDLLLHLFEAMRNHRLGGLKFLVASRTDPNIRKQIESFQFRKELWLQHISAAQASADVGTYLQKSLPKLRPEDLNKIEEHANGLFIYAATVVRFLNPGPELAPSEQVVLLNQLFSYSANIDNASPNGSLIDSLYQQILFEAFSGIPEPLRGHRLKTLHFFLSTADREDSATIGALVGDESDEIARLLVDRLHAVLYIQKDGHVTWFHSSFPEFIFNLTRSRFSYPGHDGGVLLQYDFSCNQADQQAILLGKCFDILNSQLKFNIGNIPSSFFLDSEGYVSTLEKALVHASLHWSSYLPETGGDVKYIADMISSFLQLRALFWIEAMNILAQADFCSTALDNAEKWVAQHLETNSPLHADLQEANKFVSAFVQEEELSSSTAHLYISHLAAWSEPGRLISRWKANFVSLPALTHSKSAAAVTVEDGVPRMTSTLTWVRPSLPLGPVWSVGFLEADTSKIISAHSDGSVGIWNRATGEPLKWVKGHETPMCCVAASQDGKLIVSGSEDASVFVWNLNADSGEPLNCLVGHTAPVLSVAISSNSTKVVSGSQDCSVRLWDLSKGQGPMVLTGHTGPVLSVAISQDDALVVSGSKDNTVRVWNASAGNVLQILKGHTDCVNSVAITPDKTRVVSASNDQTIRLWFRSTGRSINIFKGHSSWVHTVTISVDGSTIVSGSRDRSIRVWDAKTGQSLQALYGHTNSIFSVALSQNGLHVISGSTDGSIRVWDISGRTKSVLLSTSRPEACSSTPIDARCLNWRVSDDANWIVSTNLNPDEQRLMWRYRQVADPSTICVIGNEGYGSVDLSQSLGIIGDNWTMCYAPIPTKGVHKT